MGKPDKDLSKKAKTRKNHTNKFKVFIHQVGSDLSRAAHWAEKEGKKIFGEGEKIVDDALGAVDNTVKATGQLASGVGGVGGDFKYIPWMLAGLAGLLIWNAADVGGAVKNIGGAVRGV